MADDRIEILYFFDYLHRTGGTEENLAQLISGLSASAFGCTVVAYDLGQNPLLDELRVRGIALLHLPAACEYIPSAAGQAWRLAALSRRKRCDVVQTIRQKAATYGALVAWPAGAKHLAFSERAAGELGKPWRVLVNQCLRFLFDAFITVAEGVRIAVVPRDHLSPARVTTFLNGVHPIQPAKFYLKLCNRDARAAI